ncbi:MAG: aldolase/citrate lyase family protein [Candidatus Marinimicrobia bacterium]|nr:aldolase/citrate lyase family protein [Candidatus Neomarinimicrobiota bacterium]
MQKIAKSGNDGRSVKSDCSVEIKLKDSGGISINLKSKVKAYYENSINELCKNELEYFNIKNAEVVINDLAALDYVIMARIESAIKKLIKTEKEYLPEENLVHTRATKKDRLRRSRLYLPGNSPKFFMNAGLHNADGIILDLEDSVSPDKKDEAKILVRNTLIKADFYNSEKMVRINQLPAGLDDLKFVAPYNVNVILIPKCETAEQVIEVENKIEEIMNERKLKNTIWLMPIIESALGVVNSYKIASASDKVIALAIGLEDYTADIGTERTSEGIESFFARSQIMNSAKATGVQAIGSVFSDVSDPDGLRKYVKDAKALGFDGIGCIHPRQIAIIHESFMPTKDEISKAKKIVDAFKDAEKKGLGVVSIGSKMIDPPVVKRAEQTLKMSKNK